MTHSRSGVTRAPLALLATVALLAFAVSGAEARTGRTSAGGDLLWADRYNGLADDLDVADAVGVSPDGSKVFVTGYSFGATSDGDYATAAYDAATGDRLWGVRYNGPGNENDIPEDLVVSPDGSTVFVTGSSIGATSGTDYATIAYDAATGARLWGARSNGTGNDSDGPYDLDITPDGAIVFVTGYSTGSSSGWDYLTIAYDAATGTRLWQDRYNGPANGLDSASALAVSPDGSAVYVTGSARGATKSDYVTIAYDRVTGGRLWGARYDGPANDEDGGSAVGVSPDGSTVFVTGSSFGSASSYDYATLAYNAATGGQLWEDRYDGSGSNTDYPVALAVNAQGTLVFVTGSSMDPNVRSDYATLAYDTNTGSRVWEDRYDGPIQSHDDPRALAVSPDGSKVFVTGSSQSWGLNQDWATIAYDASGGSRLWGTRYNGPKDDYDYALALAVSPDGAMVVVTGYSYGTDADYVTAAYET